MKKQELLVIDDLLSALVGIEGRYISAKMVRGKEGLVTFQIDASTDLALQVKQKTWSINLAAFYAVLNLLNFLIQEMTKRIFPLCENFLAITQFVESRSHFKYGLVNHAFAAAIRALLLVGFSVVIIFIVI